MASRPLKLIDAALRDYVNLGFSFKYLSDGSCSVSLLFRYESRLHRIAHRAHRTFLDLRRAVASGLVAPPAAQAKPEPPSDLQNPTTGDQIAPPPEAEPTPDPKPAAALARPIPSRG